MKKLFIATVLLIISSKGHGYSGRLFKILNNKSVMDKVESLEKKDKIMTLGMNIMSAGIFESFPPSYRYEVTLTRADNSTCTIFVSEFDGEVSIKENVECKKVTEN